jgi:2-polyprenyl-3-methyl-5-hydroxy-6-metoxy-1,4-benzoquinol methylase
MTDQVVSTSAGRVDVPERFDPASMRGEIIEAEHLARYRWVSSLVEGRRVLDAGCGNAYGTALLARAGALELVGVDRASDVIHDARRDMPAKVTLDVGDVTSLDYDDGAFDLVVCFEVIEHLEDPGRALDEFRRVLSPHGLLAVSSPNRVTYPPGNPHHVHEYVPTELAEELSRRFSVVRLERQNTWITSGVLDERRFRVGNEGDLGDDLEVRKLEPDEPGEELYTVALAGKESLPEPVPVFELAARVELRKWDALWHEQARTLEAQASLLSDQERAMAKDAAETAQLRHQLARSEQELARIPVLVAQSAELAEINGELLQRNSELVERQVALDQLADMGDRYTVLVESKSWKLTRPLRAAAALARKLRR